MIIFFIGVAIAIYFASLPDPDRSARSNRSPTRGAWRADAGHSPGAPARATDTLRPASGASQAPRSQPAGSQAAGKEVQVQGYYRKNGTYVPSHSRSSPRRGLDH